MTVKIVTDSCSDIPHEEAKQLGITVVLARWFAILRLG